MTSLPSTTVAAPAPVPAHRTQAQKVRLLLVEVLLIIGLGMALCSANVWFRDVKQFVDVAVLLGFYVTPALLGSPQESLVAQLLGQRTTQLLDFEGASALGMVVLVVTLVLVAWANRVGGTIGPKRMSTPDISTIVLRPVI